MITRRLQQYGRPYQPKHSPSRYTDVTVLIVSSEDELQEMTDTLAWEIAKKGIEK